MVLWWRMPCTSKRSESHSRGLNEISSANFCAQFVAVRLSIQLFVVKDLELKSQDTLTFVIKAFSFLASLGEEQGEGL